MGECVYVCVYVCMYAVDTYNKLLSLFPAYPLQPKKPASSQPSSSLIIREPCGCAAPKTKWPKLWCYPPLPWKLINAPPSATCSLKPRRPSLPTMPMIHCHRFTFDLLLPGHFLTSLSSIPLYPNSGSFFYHKLPA